MKPNQPMTTVDQAGLALARPLAEQADQLSPEISARLESARAQAIAAARATREASAVQVDATGQAVLQGGPGNRRRFAGLLPALVVAVGLLALAQGQWLQQMMGVGEVDTAVLKDKLPPNAYGDPGFNEYLEEEQQPEGEVPADPEAEHKDKGA